MLNYFTSIALFKKSIMKKYFLLLMIAVTSLVSCTKKIDTDAGVRIDGNGRTEANQDAGVRIDGNGRS